MGRASVFTILAGTLWGLAAQAAVAPYDFTGHWVGSAKTPRKPPVTVSADLTTSVPQEFSGTLTFVATEETIHCTVNGRQQRRRVVMTVTCDNTGHARFKGALDPVNGTLSGKVVWAPPPHTHKPPKHGTFRLAKQTASHARILHGPSEAVASTTARTPSPLAVPELSTIAPPGGPQFASFTVPGPGGQGTVLTAQTFFTSPLVVQAGASVTLEIIEDMIHTVFANVTRGVASFDTSLPLPGPTDDESGSVRVFYANPPQPSYVFSPVPGPSQAWNVSPATSPVNPANGFRAGGYLGLDSNGVLCWALPTDYTYAQYSEVCEMPIVTTVGATTTLSCQHLTSAPVPVAGDTYASGCPLITPDVQRTLTLVAR